MTHQLHQNVIRLKALALALIFATFIYAIPSVLSSDYASPTIDKPGSQLTTAITSPSDGGSVPREITVKGDISGNLPTGRHIWLVVNPVDKKKLYWPQGSEISAEKMTWSQDAVIGRECGSGGEEDIGKKHIIAVISVDEKGNQDLINWVNTKEENNYPGISLPADSYIVGSIEVTRMDDC